METILLRSWYMIIESSDSSEKSLRVEGGGECCSPDLIGVLRGRREERGGVEGGVGEEERGEEWV
jgi:hypothetical protein